MAVPATAVSPSSILPAKSAMKGNALPRLSPGLHQTSSPSPLPFAAFPPKLDLCAQTTPGLRTTGMQGLLGLSSSTSDLVSYFVHNSEQSFVLFLQKIVLRVMRRGCPWDKHVMCLPIQNERASGLRRQPHLWELRGYWRQLPPSHRTVPLL